MTGRQPQRPQTGASPAPVRIPVGNGYFLSPIEPRDRTVLVTHLQDPLIAATTLLIPFPYTEADADRFLQIDAETTAQQGEPLNFAIREGDGGLIGAIGFKELVRGHRAEIGYWLARPWWGRGIMTAAVREASRFALDHWSLVRITAHVFEFNPASARVLARCGYVLEGHLRKHHLKNGQFLDAQLWALVPQVTEEASR